MLKKNKKFNFKLTNFILLYTNFVIYLSEKKTFIPTIMHNKSNDKISQAKNKEKFKQATVWIVMKMGFENETTNSRFYKKNIGGLKKWKEDRK